MNKPTQLRPDAATTIFNLPDYRVVSVVDEEETGRHVVVESVDPPGCPDCGVVAVRVHSRRRQQVRDIPVAGSHFDGNTYVNVYLHSTPMFLGSLPVDPATGLVKGTVYVPAGVTGSHHLELIGGTNGYSASTPQFTLDEDGVVGISELEDDAVVPQADSTAELRDAQLANTGAETAPILAAGAMVLLLGVLTMGAVRRRTRGTKTARR